MTAWLCALFVLVAEPGADGVEVAEFVRVDHVVAEVGDVILTRSELYAETELLRLRLGGLEELRSRPASDGLVRAVLRNMVTRELLLSEARRLVFRPESADRVAGEIRAIRERFESREDFQRFLERLGISAGKSEEEDAPGLVAIVQANLWVDRFVKLRYRVSDAIPAALIDRCLDAARSRLADVDEAKARRAVERAIDDARRAEALRAVVTQLEQRMKIRYARGWEQPPLGSGPAGDPCGTALP